jgi:hypothetical protein
MITTNISVEGYTISIDDSEVVFVNNTAFAPYASAALDSDYYKASIRTG